MTVCFLQKQCSARFTLQKSKKHFGFLLHISVSPWPRVYPILGRRLAPPKGANLHPVPFSQLNMHGKSDRYFFVLNSTWIGICIAKYMCHSLWCELWCVVPLTTIEHFRCQNTHQTSGMTIPDECQHSGVQKLVIFEQTAKINKLGGA